mmetsp:Transcript_98113/g.155174  ORF Transcript_98113/g.155174 Transcript_98113/m.155174 type:complete len:582 (+) Transcript_98113:78-1823(+)
MASLSEAKEMAERKRSCGASVSQEFMQKRLASSSTLTMHGHPLGSNAPRTSRAHDRHFGCLEGCLRSLLEHLSQRRQHRHRCSQLRESTKTTKINGRPLLDILGEDTSVSGGASIVMVYRFLNLWEVYFAARPCARSFADAARSCFSGTDRPFRIVPEDIDRLRTFLWDVHQTDAREHHNEGLEADYVGRLMRAAPEKVVMLGLPLGVSNSTLRGWVRQGLLSHVVELHLMGHGGPSDAGLTNLVTHCPKLRQLTILCSGITAAATLVLHAQISGDLSHSWWEGVRFSRLCVLPRLQMAPQPKLSLQRVPPWLCGEWLPVTHVWGFEVHHYDPLGRFVFLRNGAVERVGVVRSCVPSPFGNWWELDLCFFARQAWFEQLMLVMQLSGPSNGESQWTPGPRARWEAHEEVEPEVPGWVSVALGLADPDRREVPTSVHPFGLADRRQPHLGMLRTAVIGPSEQVRHRPRQFPQQGRRVGDWMRRSCNDSITTIYPWSTREWAEAALESSAEGQDATLIFDHTDSSEEEGAGQMPSMQELLEQLDREEQPSRRAEEGSALPSLEDLISQLDVEEERDRSRANTV